MLTVRPARMADAADLYRWAVGSPDRRAVVSPPTRLLRAASGVAHRSAGLGRPALIVEQDGTPIATVRLVPLPDDEMEIHLTIAPEWRGQRLATPIIEAACARARAEGAQLVIAQIKAENAPSLRAFQAAGFTWFGTRATGATTTAHMLRRAL